MVVWEMLGSENVPGQIEITFKSIELVLVNKYHWNLKKNALITLMK